MHAFSTFYVPGYTRRMLLDTMAFLNMIILRVVNQYFFNCINIKVWSVRLVDSRNLTITWKSKSYSVRLSELQAIFSDLFMLKPNIYVIANINWMRHSHLYIDWDNSVINLAWNNIIFWLFFWDA